MSVYTFLNVRREADILCLSVEKRLPWILQPYVSIQHTVTLKTFIWLMSILKIVSISRA